PLNSTLSGCRAMKTAAAKRAIQGPAGENAIASPATIGSAIIPQAPCSAGSKIRFRLTAGLMGWVTIAIFVAIRLLFTPQPLHPQVQPHAGRARCSRGVYGGA